MWECWIPAVTVIAHSLLVFSVKSTGLRDQGVYLDFCDTRTSPRLYGGVSLWEALSLVSQKWSFPTAP